MFKPSVHGWPFAHPAGPEPEVLGLGRSPRGPSTPAQLAGGMCWSALDRYLAGARIPHAAESPDPGSSLHTELVRRQVAALDGVWPRVRDWQARRDGSWRDRLPLRVGLPGGSDLTSTSRAAWAGIRKKLDAGEPVLLTLLTESEAYASPEAALQMLACGYTREAGKVTVMLYDPARPGQDDVRLGFRASGPLEARLTGGRAIRGFFAVPYDRARPRTIRAETFADRSVIGLNRKVRGCPAVVAVRRGLEIVARNGDGALLHFARHGSQPWEGANVTERAAMGGSELHSDPVALAASWRGVHAFARSYVGDLLHFRCLPGFRAVPRWRVANRTDGKRAGPRFRLEGQPVPIRGGGFPGSIHVFGRGKDGVLVQYTGSALRGWSATDIPSTDGQRLADDPVVAIQDGSLHVFGVTRDGRLLHFSHLDDAWHLQEPLTSLAAGRSMRFEGRPTVIVAGGSMHVFGRSPDGELLNVSIQERGYDGGIVAKAITDDPSACDGPGGVHVFAPTAEGVVHAWNGPEWRVEDVVGSRSGLDSGVSPAGGLVAWGSPDELRVFGRNAQDLVALRWSPDADWTAHLAHQIQGVDDRHRPGEDPLLATDRLGRPHLFATDGRGTLVHYEESDWREPEGTARAAASTGASTAPGTTADRPGKAQKATAAGPAAAAGSAPGPTASGAPAETPPRVDSPRASEVEEAAPATALESAPNADSLPLLDLDGPGGDAGSDPLPLLDLDESEEEAEGDALPLLDMDVGTEEEEVVEVEEDPLPPLELDVPAEDGEVAQQPSKEDFSWASVDPKARHKESEDEELEDEDASAGSGGSDEMEPLDLSLLESWPPAPPSMRQKDRGKKKDTA